MAITNDNLCLTIMEDFAAMAGEANDPMKNRQKTGLLDSLVSPVNVNGTEIEASYAPGDGKAHKVIVKYMSPDAEADVDDTVTNICDDECVTTAYKYDEVTLTLASQSEVKCLTEAQMRELCESGPEFRTKIINGMYNSLARKINSKIITPFYNGAGGLLSGNGAIGTEFDLLFQATGGQPEIYNYGEILMRRALEDAGLMSTPIIVGSNNIDTWRSLKAIGCCNDYGQDNGASNIGDYNFFYDNQLNTVLTAPSDSGDDAFYVYAPGMAQFVSKPLNVGQFRRITDDTIFDTITDPRTGLVYDFEMIYDRCTRTWKWKLYLNYDLWQAPLDLYESNDSRYKINQNWVFQATTEAGA